MRVNLNCLFFIFRYYALLYTLAVISGSCQFPTAHAASIGARGAYPFSHAEGLEPCEGSLGEDCIYDRSSDADVIPVPSYSDVIESTGETSSDSVTLPSATSWPPSSSVPRAAATESSATFEDSFGHVNPLVSVPTSIPVIISVFPIPIPFTTFTFTIPTTSTSSSPSTSTSSTSTTSSIASSTTSSSLTTSSTSTTTTTSSTTTLSTSSGTTTASSTSTSAVSSSTSESLASGTKLSSTLIAIITMLSFLGILSLVLGIIVVLRTRKRRLAAIQRTPDVESAGQPQAFRGSSNIGGSSTERTYLGSRFSVTTIASNESRRTWQTPTPEMSVVAPGQYYASMFSGRRTLMPLPNPYDGWDDANGPPRPMSYGG